MKKATIVLDLDGTLLDTSYRHYQVFLDVTHQRQFKCDIARKDFWQWKRAGASTETILERYSENKDLTYKINRDWTSKIECNQYLDLDRLQPGAKALLGKIADLGELAWLLTARSRKDSLVWQLKRLELFAHFQEIICVDPFEAKNEKCAHLLSFASCVFIGDSESDFFAAKEAGIDFLAIENGQRSGEFLKQRCHDIAIAKNLRDPKVERFLTNRD